MRYNPKTETVSRVVPLERGDYHWHFMQECTGRRFLPSHRVFGLTTIFATGADEALWRRVMDWLDRMGWTIDGWTFRDQGGGLGSAVWRFRAGQRAEAELFEQVWVYGNVSPFLATLDPRALTMQ